MVYWTTVDIDGDPPARLLNDNKEFSSRRRSLARNLHLFSDIVASVGYKNGGAFDGTFKQNSCIAACIGAASVGKPIRNLRYYDKGSINLFISDYMS